VCGDLGHDQVEELLRPADPATQHDQMGSATAMTALDRPRDKGRLTRHHTSRAVVAVGGIDVRMIHHADGSTADPVDIAGSRAG